MQYKTLGDTGLLVSTICFGCMTFHGGSGFWTKVGTVDQAGADELIKGCLDKGVNFFDTADVYSEGESEKTLGQSLKNLNIARKDVVIATKVFGRTGPGRNDVGASRGHIMDAIDASLTRLQHQLHRPLPNPRQRQPSPPSKRPSTPSTPSSSNPARSATSASPTGLAWKISKAPSPRPTSSKASPASTHCRPTTPSPAATSSAKSSLILKHDQDRPARLEPTRRWPPQRQIQPRHTRSPKAPAAPTSTSPSSTRNAPGASSTSCAPIAEGPQLLGQPASHSPGSSTKPVITSIIIGAKRTDQLHDNLAAVDLKLSPEELKQLDEVSKPSHPSTPAGCSPSRAPAVSIPP